MQGDPFALAGPPARLENRQQLQKLPDPFRNAESLQNQELMSIIRAQQHRLHRALHAVNPANPLSDPDAAPESQVSAAGAVPQQGPRRDRQTTNLAPASEESLAALMEADLGPTRDNGTSMAENGTSKMTPPGDIEVQNPAP